MDKDTQDYKEVSVIIPAHNEAGNIPVLARAFEEMFARSGIKGEVVFINDGSTDDTAQAIKQSQRDHHFIRYLEHDNRKGITASLLSGFEHVCGKYIVFFPADLQYLPQELPAFIERLRQGYDMVTGWRQGRQPLEKRLVSFCYNLIATKVLFRVPVHDLNSIKAFTREVMAALKLRKGWHRFIAILAAEKGFKITELKVDLYPRRYGESKFKGSGRIFSGFCGLIGLKYQLLRGKV